MSSPQAKQSFSEGGTITIANTTAVNLGGQTPPLRAVAIQCITETVFTALTDTTARSGLGTANTGPTYPAGFTLYGSFRNIQLASGSVRVTLASDLK